jgi:hypothetical protein
MDLSHPQVRPLVPNEGALGARPQLTSGHPPTEEQTAFTIWDRPRPFRDDECLGKAVSMMELRHTTHLEGWLSELGHLPLRQAHWHTLILRAPAGGPRPAGGSRGCHGLWGRWSGISACCDDSWWVGPSRCSQCPAPARRRNCGKGAALRPRRLLAATEARLRWRTRTRRAPFRFFPDCDFTAGNFLINHSFKLI